MHEESKPKPGPGTAKLSLKVFLLVAAAMVLEAAVIIGVAIMTNTPAVQAGEFTSDPAARLDRLVEIPVVSQRFPNSKQGVTYLYDTEVAVQVKARHEEAVRQILEENEARITTLIGTLWRQAEPRHFDEPHLSTLSRQLEEGLGSILGEDPNTNEPRLQGILIPVLTGFRVDY